MKARVKATGEIVDGNAMVSFNGDDFYLDELEAIIDETEKIYDELDEAYWKNLEHQYAGMVMQGIMSNHEYLRSLVQRVAGGEIPNLAEGITKHAEQLAHTLVEKLKEEEKK